MLSGGEAELLRVVPLWGSFVLLAGILARQVVPWRKLSLDAAAQIREEMKERIDELKEQHKDCLNDMKALQEEMAGQRRQHLQEQISLINAIINSVDSPALKGLLKALESVQATLSLKVLQTQDEGVIQPEDK